MTGTLQLHRGDSLEILRSMPDNSVDSIVTDPPYGLSFMGKKWDYDVPATELWAECLRVLKPGGHLLAFAGTRTQHRMAVRIEDAGFEIRDMLAWVYGSGFPKSHNGPWGGTALKPALEPITMARKPLEGTVAANVTEHGTGGLNIDGCRVGDFVNTTPSGVDRRNAALAEAGYRPGAYQKGETVPSEAEGRWPANLIHDGSPEVLEVFPDSNGSGPARTIFRGKKEQNGWGMNTTAPDTVSMPDAGKGSAARFFYCAKTSKKERNAGCEALPEKQAAGLPMRAAGGERGGEGGDGTPTDRLTTQRNNHPTVKPLDLMAYLCRLVTPPGGVVLDPFMGSGSTGVAALREGFRFIGCELQPEYHAIANARLEHHFASEFV